MHNIKFDLYVNKEKIECESFTLKEYIKFLLAKQSDDSALLKKWMEEVLKTNTTYTKFVKPECEYILINLLAKSVRQNKIEKEYVCECGNEFDVTIDPTKIYIDDENYKMDELYPFLNFKLKLQQPNLFEDDNIPLMILKSIKEIYVGDDVIKINDLAENEFDDLISAITPTDMDNIKEILLKPTIRTDIPIVCPKCGKAHVQSVIGFKEFIELLK